MKSKVYYKIQYQSKNYKNCWYTIGPCNIKDEADARKWLDITKKEMRDFTLRIIKYTEIVEIIEL